MPGPLCIYYHVNGCLPLSRYEKVVVRLGYLLYYSKLCIDMVYYTILKGIADYKEDSQSEGIILLIPTGPAIRAYSAELAELAELAKLVEHMSLVVHADMSVFMGTMSVFMGTMPCLWGLFQCLWGLFQCSWSSCQCSF